MAIKQILFKNVNGQNIYECSGDYEGVLNVVESDPLYEEITNVFKNAEDIVKKIIEERERNKPKLEDSIIVNFNENDKPVVIHTEDDGRDIATTDVVTVNGWMIIPATVEDNSKMACLLVYRPGGPIESAKYVVYDKNEHVKVDILRTIDGVEYVDISKQFINPEITDAEIVNKTDSDGEKVQPADYNEIKSEVSNK